MKAKIVFMSDKVSSYSSNQGGVYEEKANEYEMKIKKLEEK